ncbi:MULTISPECIES: FUSC family protein [Pseudomonas]|uniref:FUSC family protein n=1 Tax=Pseudomonas TaxID=286 RepID=UPI0015BAEE6A|nr:MULTISPECIES: FUSC family protein [Pseudomonas]MDH4846073.1 FUSC family protein [Pseudomonas sp. BN605]MDH4858745.1 FUSC family protein [Pseudomonas sp. BN505]NWL08024.1 FUSC family protein [Pseudomonas hunanensis]
MFFERSRWTFSIKLFLAAMLAYWLSVHLALPQSYWAVVTCCVVMNPTTGGVYSKSVYRFTGTLCGGVSALILAGMLSTIPLMLVAVSGLIACAAFAWAVLDRTPRAYGYQLFGVTLLLVALASIDQPQLIFDTAAARVLEIGLGIFCCWIVDSILAPRSLAPVLHQRIRQWIPHMRSWLEDEFLVRPNSEQGRLEQQKSITDITSLSLLVSQLDYDPMVNRQEREYAVAIQHRLLQLMPMLSSIRGHLDCLEPDRRSRMLAWLEATWRVANTQDSQLDEHLRSPEATPSAADEWPTLIELNLRHVAGDVLRIWGTIQHLAEGLAKPQRLSPALKALAHGTAPFPLQPDFYMARRVFLAAALAYSAVAALWCITGWTQGANATLMGMVAIGFFGHLDEAGKAIGKFGKFNALALALAAVVAYGLLPFAQDFPSLALVLAMVMLPLGAWAATNPMAVLMMAIALSNINLQAQYTPLEFGVFLDTASGSLLGILTGYFCLVTIRHMGPAHLRERFIKLERRDVLKLSYRADARSLGEYANRALDRAAALATRITADDQLQYQRLGLLAWLRLGMAVGSTRRALEGVTGQRRRVCEGLLARIREALKGDELALTPELTDAIDTTIALVWRQARPYPDSLVRGLIGLRLALCAAQQPVKEPV